MQMLSFTRPESGTIKGKIRDRLDVATIVFIHVEPQAAPWTPMSISVRHMTSIYSTTGIPAPRLDVSTALSTNHGGHIVRMIKLTESLVMLDDAMWDFRRKLKTIHVVAAAQKLGSLVKAERSSVYGFKV
jgi:hypothetical protein